MYSRPVARNFSQGAMFNAPYTVDQHTLIWGLFRQIKRTFLIEYFGLKVMFNTRFLAVVKDLNACNFISYQNGFYICKHSRVMCNLQLQCPTHPTFPYLWSKAYQRQELTLLDYRHRLEHKSPCYVPLALAKLFLKTFSFEIAWKKFFMRTLAPVSLALGLGLWYSCPWPGEGLSLERPRIFFVS